MYTTRGFIVGSRESGEADRILFLYTQEFGLVSVAARGTRKLQSKLRLNITDYSFGEYTLVRGRETWRLTGAKTEKKCAYILSIPQKIDNVAEVFSVLLRLVHGEGKDESVFGVLADYIEYVCACDNLYNLKTASVLASARLLYALGYLINDGTTEKILQPSDWQASMGLLLCGGTKILSTKIGSALAETQL